MKRKIVPDVLDQALKQKRRRGKAGEVSAGRGASRVVESKDLSKNREAGTMGGKKEGGRVYATSLAQPGTFFPSSPASRWRTDRHNLPGS